MLLHFGERPSPQSLGREMRVVMIPLNSLRLRETNKEAWGPEWLFHLSSSSRGAPDLAEVGGEWGSPQAGWEPGGRVRGVGVVPIAGCGAQCQPHLPWPLAAGVQAACPGCAQAEAALRSSWRPSSGQPWRPQWHPRRQRRTHQGRQSHPAARPGPRPARPGSSCPFPAPPWWPLAPCP